MKKIFVILLTIFILQTSVYAADKIRIGFPELAALYVPLPLGQKRGFFQEEGLQAEFIRMNPTVGLAALVSGEIKAGIKGNRYIHQNREGTIQVMIEWLKIDREMATATYESVLKAFNEDGSLPEDGLRVVIEEAKKAAKVNREVSFDEVADLSILREAQRELGIRGP